MRNEPPGPFVLEQTYREQFKAGVFDLSSSAPSSSSLDDLFDSDVARRTFLATPLSYGRGGGDLELRAAIAELYDDLSPENVLVTAGGLEAIRAAAMALVSPASRVLVQRPSYAALAQAVRDQGGEIVPLDADAGGHFDLAGCPDADIALLNSPYGLGGTEVRGMGNFGGRLIVDEVYRPIELVPGIAHLSVINLSNTAVAIGDLSKPLGLGGLRVGWIVSRDRAAIERCAQALDYLSGSISVLSSAAALLALGRFDEILAGHTARVRSNLRHWAVFAERHEAWLEWTPPQAGFNVDVRLKGGPLPGAAFDHLRDSGVFLLPGEALGLPGHLRIGIGGAEEDFALALEHFGAELRQIPAGQTCQPSSDVILLTKAPQPGFGKSRLAASIGADVTFDLATAFIRDTINLAAPRARQLFVAAAPTEAVAEIASATPGAVVYAQAEAAFGERLALAFNDAFSRGARKPILLGSDSPTLPGTFIPMAHRALKSYDVVIGPAEDGGYYAIGLHSPQPQLFEGIDWSTAAVLQQTLDRCASLNLRVCCLPYWYDIDDEAGLARLAEDPLLRPATAAALARL